MLPRAARISSGSDFRYIKFKGTKGSYPSFLSFVVPNRQGRSRLGVIVSAKIGSSVKRKRASRVLRSAYAQVAAESLVGQDVVLIARPYVLSKTSTEVAAELRRLTPRPRIGV